MARLLIPALFFALTLSTVSSAFFHGLFGKARHRAPAVMAPRQNPGQGSGIEGTLRKKKGKFVLEVANGEGQTTFELRPQSAVPRRKEGQKITVFGNVTQNKGKLVLNVNSIDCGCSPKLR